MGVGLRTVGHWETGETAPSYAAFKLLRVFRQGEFIDPAWSGYRLVRGVLVTPEGREVRPHDMSWIGLLLGRARLARELAKERDRLRADLAALQSEASAASLGLVYIGTSRTGFAETLMSHGFRLNCSGAIMGPQWGHENLSPEARSQEVQSPDTRGSDGRSAAGGRSDGHQPQCVLPAGDPQFHGVHASRAVAADAAIQGAYRNNFGLSAEGRPQRSVPLRQRQEGQALPSGIDLTGGAA